MNNAKQTLTQEQIEAIRKQDLKESKISHGNHNIATNAFIIRETYRLFAELAGIKNPTAHLYKYLNCTDKSYDKIIALEGFPNKIREGLLELGVPKNCLRKDHATLLTMSEALLDACYNKLDNKMTLLAFREILKTNLLYVADKNNLMLIVLANQMVRKVYNSLETPENRVADFFNALAEFDMSEADMKQKDLYNNLVKIAESYIYDNYDTDN